VGQEDAGTSALQGQAWVYEGGGPAVMVHEERLREKHNHVKLCQQKQVGRRV